MEKTTTLVKTSFQLLLKGALLSLLTIFSFSSDLFAQYSVPNHYFGCQYNTTGYIAAINDFVVEDNSGNVLFNKPGDECNQTTSGVNVTGGHYNEMTLTPSFTLSSGGTYTIKINCTNPGNYTLGAVVGIWIDVNGDEDFSDAGEFITPNSWQVPSAANNANAGSYGELEFTVPCGNFEGSTRMRIRSNYNAYSITSSSHSSTGTAFYYGETEDYTIAIAKPTGLNASAFIPDTAFIGTVVNFVNGNQTGYISHAWDVGNNGSVDYTTTNAQHIFNAVGTYSVKLKSVNCLGADSVVKQVVIVAPTAPPVADFVATKNRVELFDVFNLVDLSTNGPTYWSYYVTDGADTIYYQGGNPFIHKNPEIFTGTNAVGFPKIFPDAGFWDVCLVASNSIGSSSITCKQNYIEVTKSTFNMGPETSLPANIIGIAEGTLYDKGGPLNNYTVPESNLEALIAPCGAKSVTLEFKQFKLLANANIKIYDGTDATGTPLHTGNGFTLGNEPTGPITSNSGTLYLLFNSTAGGTDSGFVATWTSVQGSGDPPVADFDLPGSTVYNSVWVDFINTSQNAEGNVDFEWRVDGVLASLGRDLEWVFTVNGTHTIQLRVIGCDGTVSTSTKQVVVAHPWYSNHG